MVDIFKNLLHDISDQQTAEFSGIGLVLYNDILSLPVVGLILPNKSLELPIADYDKNLAVLLKISESTHPNHDGFHFISDNNFALTHISQYFATPIVSTIEPEFRHGSRYRSAFYGSFLNGVVACGVLSKNYPPTLFIKGAKTEL
jgi:hypothetical protein